MSMTTTIKMDEDDVFAYINGTERRLREYYAPDDDSDGFGGDEAWLDCCGYDIDKCMEEQPMSENLENFKNVLVSQKELLDRVRGDRRKVDRIKKMCEKLGLDWTEWGEMYAIDDQIDTMIGGLQDKIYDLNTHIKNIKSVVNSVKAAQKNMAKATAKYAELRR